MLTRITFIIALFALLVLQYSCSTIEKASVHGFNSGNYRLKTAGMPAQDVYLDIGNDKIDIYKRLSDRDTLNLLTSASLDETAQALSAPLLFRKRSLDVDITSVLLKFRTPANNMPAQVNTDLNFALYTGWRFDSYRLTTRKNQLGRFSPKLNSSGFDIGFFAGPGTTVINSFTTQNMTGNEYNGLIIQSGLAAFMESEFASFGLGIGLDYLMNSDRKIWIYHNKPWYGFIVGIALN